MLAKRVLVREALVAGVAAVRLVRHVGAGMGLEVGELRERLAAARVLALVRLLARVGADVLLQVAQLGEAPLADLALVRLDARVDAGVLRQVGGVGKTLIARGTFIGLGVLLMHMLTMNQQVRLGIKDVVTHAAVVGLDAARAPSRSRPSHAARTPLLRPFDGLWDHQGGAGTAVWGGVPSSTPHGVGG